MARVPCTHMIRFLDFREADSIEVKSSPPVSGQINKNGFHTFMSTSKGQPMRFQSTPCQIVRGRPCHRRQRPSAGSNKMGPLSGRVPPPAWLRLQVAAMAGGRVRHGRPRSDTSPVPRAERTAHVAPSFRRRRLPAKSRWNLHSGASGNRPSRPAAATNRPQRGRRRQRRRQPPPPPGGRRPPQAGGLSSTAAAVASSASCGRPAGAAAAARDSGGRRRRGGYGATRPCARALDALR